MFPEAFALLALIAGGAIEAPPLEAKLNALPEALALVANAPFFADVLPGAKFRPADRAVTNWRFEATTNLDLSPASATKLIADRTPASIARCVKLNNYWCVKRAGWAGEIAADSEGHVAFASAIEGATVAAVLLRRYYLDYHRHSALAILSRWAPAQCGTATSALRRSAPRARPAQISAGTLAIRGLGNTLRARWLAAHRPGQAGAGKAVALRRSVVADRPVPLMRAPQIAVGMGEANVERAPARPAALDLISSAALQPEAPPGPVSGASCPSETLRIRNYALRAIEGIGSNPDEDLKLFSPDGTPGENLAGLMRNMALVEIGPLAARDELIAAAIEIAAERGRVAGKVAGDAH